jgi:hypothetical protein
MAETQSFLMGNTLGTMAYTPLHHNLHRTVGTVVLTVEAVGMGEGVSVDGQNLLGYGKTVLGRS